MGGDKRLFFKLNLAQRLLFNYFDREMIEKAGVPIVQAAALFFLKDREGCLLKDLSEGLLQNKSAVTTLVERMVKNGLLIKKASDSDGRAVHLYLSEKGRKAAEKALPLVKENNARLTEQFKEEEIELIHSFFDKIISIYS